MAQIDSIVEEVTALKQTGVTLTLSNEEARALAVVLGFVGGCPVTSIRKHLKSLEWLLSDAGYQMESPLALAAADKQPLSFKDDTAHLVEDERGG